MINLLLEWNAQDTVSVIEDNRNNYHENTSNSYAQGNRNPFIDNPNLATQIWGGFGAQNRWATASVNKNTLLSKISIFPNPSTIKSIHIKIPHTIEVQKITLYSVIGKEIYSKTTPSTQNGIHSITSLRSGIYILKISGEYSTITKKVIIQ